jgi:protein-tyrosine phosphatase
MTLDYSDPEKSANFRDVGLFVNLILGRRSLEEGKLLRGGSIKNVLDFSNIGNPVTILCLKNGSNLTRSGIRTFHFPRPNTSDCYLTGEHDVRSWLRAIVRSLAEPNLALPLYIHCHSGRDRTGVVVATLLRILNIPTEAIIEEFLLSEGADRAKISSAMTGIEDVNSYFPSNHLMAIRRALLCV